MRIVVSTPIFLPLVGGAELGIHEIYSRLGKHHDVTIVTPTVRQVHVDNFGADDYTGGNYEVRRIGSALDAVRPGLVGRGLKRTFFPYFAALQQLSRRESADVINYHYLSPHGFALVALRALGGVPSVVSLVGRSDVGRTLSLPMKLHARVVLAASDVVVPNSAYYLRNFYTSSKVRVIPYGVDVSDFSPERRSISLRQSLGVQDSEGLLLTVQRLAPLKRVDILLRVLAALIRRGHNPTLVVVGQGSERQRLGELARDLNVSHAVRFMGYIPRTELGAYFASADAFVFHSLSETFGIVLAQAMAAGLPIVAARSSSIPDVVRPENGLLVDPFDVPAFTHAVETVLSHAAATGAMRSANRRHAVEALDWDKIASDYEDVLGQAAFGRQRPDGEVRP